MGRTPYKDPNDVRSDTFAMRVNAAERRMLGALARQLRRSQSDTVRLLIREAVRELARPTEAEGLSEPSKAQMQQNHII